MLTQQKIRDIPAQTLGVWAMVQLGINPKIKYGYQTYLKHRTVLRAHGIDIQPEVSELECESV